MVDGHAFDVLRTDESGPVYTLCTASTPRSCGQLPATERRTSVAVPTSGGAVLFEGSDGNSGPESGDRIQVRVAGEDTAPEEPAVTFVESPLLDYPIAAFSVPTFEPLYCLTVTGDGQPPSYIGLSGVNDPGLEC